jgi:hypothetical protein
VVTWPELCYTGVNLAIIPSVCYVMLCCVVLCYVMFMLKITFYFVHPLVGKDYIAIADSEPRRTINMSSRLSVLSFTARPLAVDQSHHTVTCVSCGKTLF